VPIFGYGALASIIGKDSQPTDSFGAFVVRLLFIGDIVGKPGRQIVVDGMRTIRKVHRLDLVVANGENSAGGSGITPEIYRELLRAGVDGITLGDHIYRRSEILTVLAEQPNIVKPANYPADAPGKDHMLLTAADGTRVAVVSLLGRVFMKPVDCPWNAIDRVLGELPADVRVILVDVHAEATSDKQLLGRHLDGKVSAVLGTHTHVATADEQIFPGGTAFQCDVGMTGPHEGILGREITPVLATTRTFRHNHFEVAQRDVRMCGTIVDVDPATGKATAIERLVVRTEDVAAMKAAS